MWGLVPELALDHHRRLEDVTRGEVVEGERGRVEVRLQNRDTIDAAGHGHVAVDQRDGASAVGTEVVGIRSVEDSVVADVDPLIVRIARRRASATLVGVVARVRRTVILRVRLERHLGLGDLVLLDGGVATTGQVVSAGGHVEGDPVEGRLRRVAELEVQAPGREARDRLLRASELLAVRRVDRADLGRATVRGVDEQAAGVGRRAARVGVVRVVAVPGGAAAVAGEQGEGREGPQELGGHGVSPRGLSAARGVLPLELLEKRKRWHAKACQSHLGCERS